MDEKNDVLVACTIGDLAWLKHGLLRGINANTRDREGLNGLHLAALNGKLECMKHLLDNCGITVDAIAASTGNTALHYCISKKNGVKNVRCLKLLLERGANQNKQNKAGLTPLHFTAKVGLVKSMKALLEHGADIHITDKEGNTAYHTACVHSHLECARLLRSLHWASNKDSSINQLRKEEALQQAREREKRALHTRLRREAADSAYASWLEKNDFNSRASTPSASMRRKQVRSQPERASRCHTCSLSVTQQQSARVTHSGPGPVAPIKVSLQQTERNVSSVGKPDKMYPYSNYPPQSLRRHKYANRGASSQSKSNRSSRAVSTITRSMSRATTPSSVGARHYRRLFKQKQPKAEATPSPDRQSVLAIEPSVPSDSPPQANNLQNGATDLPTSHTPSGDNQEEMFRDASTLREENDGAIEFFVGDAEDIQGLKDDGDDDDLDDLAFHDVGHANSLASLSLPGVLMKGKTPAEVLQLLRYLGNPDPRSLRRSRSYTHNSSRHAMFRNKFQRRLSLGAIPEGEMVTNYSSIEPSTSQLLDDRYFEPAVHGYLGGSQGRESTRNAWGGDEAEYNQEDMAGSNSEDDSSSEYDDSADSSDDAESSNLAEINLPQYFERNATRLKHSESDSLLLKRRQPAEPRRLLKTAASVQLLHSRKVSCPRSLKIVNLAWHPELNAVQTQVTESPMTEMSFSKLGRKGTLQSRSISPRSRLCSSNESLRSASPQDSGRFSSRSPSPQDLRTRPRSTSPHELNSSLSWDATPVPNPLADVPSSSDTDPRFPSHSLFSMSAVVSKSVVSLSDIHVPTPNPPLARRAKSAPNLDNQVLKSALFQFGRTLKHSQ